MLETVEMLSSADESAGAERPAQGPHGSGAACRLWSDRELVNRAVAGDVRAGDTLVDRFGRLVYHVLRSTGVSPDEQDDLFQQVFLNLWEHDCRRLRQWQGRGRLSSYLSVLTARLAQDHHARAQARPAVWSLDAEEGLCGHPGRLVRESADPEATVIRRQQQLALLAAVRHLCPRDAELIRSRYLQQQSYREIAGALGLTVNAAGVALQRAEARLRKLLTQEYEGLFA